MKHSVVADLMDILPWWDIGVPTTSSRLKTEHKLFPHINTTPVEKLEHYLFPWTEKTRSLSDKTPTTLPSGAVRVLLSSFTEHGTGWGEVQIPD